jgi:hypothetical protein
MNYQKVNGKWKTMTETSGRSAESPTLIWNALGSGITDNTFERIDPSEIPK